MSLDRSVVIRCDRPGCIAYVTAPPDKSASQARSWAVRLGWDRVRVDGHTVDRCPSHRNWRPGPMPDLPIERYEGVDD